MSWNIGDDQSIFLKLKSNLRFHLIVLTTQKTSPENLTLSVVEKQQLLDIEQTDSQEEISCLKKTTYIDRRKVCVNFKTDTDNLNIVVYSYRNYLYLKDYAVDLKLTEDHLLLTKRVYLLSVIGVFTSSAFYWMIQLFITKTIFVKNRFSLSNEHFAIVPGIKNVK